MKRIQRCRQLPALALGLAALGLSACTTERTVMEDLDQKAQFFYRDMNDSWDAFSKYFFNHDPNDPYLD